MRLYVLFFIILSVVCTGTALLADDAAQSSSRVLLNPECPKWTDRNYKVDVTVKGKIPTPDGKSMMDTDSSIMLEEKHRYTRREDDGLMPLEITVTKGDAIIRDKANDIEQKIGIPPESYPKLTVLLDSSCRMTNVFGISGTKYAEGMPGLNYSNMIVLFIPDMGGQARGVGEKWETKITIPSYKETYAILNTLKSVNPMERTAVITQEISWNPRGDVNATSKATAESVFSTDDGKLVKSHAECQVMQKYVGVNKESTSSQQEPLGSRTNITVDISLIK